MDIILLEDIRKLGKLGDTVSVKSGYARNFLVPQGMAVRATKDNLAMFEERRAELERIAKDALAAAQARAEKLNELVVTIERLAGEEGKLFGSVGTHDIADAISEASGVEIIKREVMMPDGAIRSIGEYDIDLSLHNEVNVSIKIVVANTEA
ncbi:MAG TPA: 50S ribosomal protein L9 [Aeromonadales bacterium]|nr:50S ribosomal protein L9 [Aeromonadales bacterium]